MYLIIICIYFLYFKKKLSKNIKLNNKTKKQSINNFRFKSLKNSELNSKYLNIIKKIRKKSIISVLPSKEKGKSFIINNSKNIKKLNILRLTSQQSNTSKKQKDKYISYFFKYSQQILRKKYNCSQIVKNKLYKKEEVINLYDSYQIGYLIQKIKSRIFCKLKELSFLYNSQEYLMDIYNPKESKIILKYLLFFVYDKIKLIYNEKEIGKKINKNKIKSNFEKINPFLKKGTMLLNKLNYKLIFNISPFDINNFIPNLYPNDIKIIKILKEYIKKNLYQKYFRNDYYYKNMKKNSKENNNNSKSQTIINKPLSKYFFEKKNNAINNQKENKRIENDSDIFDVEKLIKEFKIKNKQIIKNQFLNKKNKFNKKIFSQKIKKKLLYNYSDINNRDTSYEKNSLSQNSITSLINFKENKKDSKFGYIFKNKLTKHILQNNNINYKKSLNSSDNNNLESSISFENRFIKKTLKNSYLRKKIIFNNKDENSESQILENFKYSIIKNTKNNNNNSKERKFKFINLRDILKMEDKTKNNSSKRPVKLINTLRSFNYQNELPIFRKRRNENIWEKGEDLSAQIKAEEVKEKVYKKMKAMNNKTINNLKKCYTFRKMVDYGEIYFSKYSFN